MDDDGDLHEQILHIETHIEQLADVIESCRKFILISKAAMATGGTLILAVIIGAVGFDSTIMIGALAAVIGGTVVCGSNKSTSSGPPRTPARRILCDQTQAHSGLQCPELAQLRPQIVPWSTLCRADWVRNDPVLTTRG